MSTRFSDTYSTSQIHQTKISWQKFPNYRQTHNNTRTDSSTVHWFRWFYFQEHLSFNFVTTVKSKHIMHVSYRTEPSQQYPLLWRNVQTYITKSSNCLHKNKFMSRFQKLMEDSSWQKKSDSNWNFNIRSTTMKFSPVWLHTIVIDTQQIKLLGKTLLF